MPVRYATLRARDWTRLSDAAQEWQRVADDLDKEVAEFDRAVVRPISGRSWRGEAAEAAKAKVRQSATRIAAAQKYLDANALLMQAAYDGIWTAWSRTTDSWATPPAEVTMDDEGRVSFRSAPETFDWYFPPILTMMMSQALAYQALHMADVVNRKIAPPMWYPPNRSVDDIPPVADADENLRQARQTCREVEDELGRISVDPQSWKEDTALQPRGDIAREERDETLWVVLKMAADYLRLSGRSHGADYLEHWLGNSGKTKYVDPNEIRRGLPKFDRIVRDAIATAPTEGCFDTEWTPTDVLEEDDAQSGDWWYAMNHFRYRVVGYSIIVDGERSINYTVGVLKPYVFGPPRDPIKIPHTGLEVDQADIARLHHVGYAQNFIIQGLAHGTA